MVVTGGIEMGYRIIYGPEQQHPVSDRRKNHFWLQTGFFFVVFLISVHMLWPEGAAALRSVITPVDEQTAECFQNMVSSIKEGESVAEAFYGFCREILNHAGIS